MEKVRAAKRHHREHAPITFLKRRPFALAVAACLIVVLSASGVLSDLNRIYVFGRPTPATDAAGGGAAAYGAPTTEATTGAMTEAAIFAAPEEAMKQRIALETQTAADAETETGNGTKSAAGQGEEAPPGIMAAPAPAGAPADGDQSWTVTVYSRAFAYFMHATGGQAIPPELEAVLYADMGNTLRYHVFAGASPDRRDAVAAALQAAGFYVEVLDDYGRVPQLDAGAQEGLVVVDIAK